MGYPEWVRGVPSRELPWNDDTPEFCCDGCELATNNSKRVEFRKDKKGEYWLCLDCKHRNYY